MARPSLDEIFGVAKPEQGFMDRAGARVLGRANELADNIVAYKTGDISLPTLGGAFIGKAGAGTINDIIGEGVVSGYKALPESAQQGIASAGKYIAESPVGDAARYVGGKYGELKAAHPELAINLESAANVAALLPAGKGSVATEKAVKTAGKGVSAVGDKIVQSGANAAKANRAEFVQKLITPKETAKVLNEQATNAVEEGLLRTRKVIPDRFEQGVIDTVSELPVSKWKSSLGNYNVLKKSLGDEAQSLSGKLKGSNVAVGLDDVQGSVNRAFDKLKANPLLTGDASETAMKVMEGYNKTLMDIAVRDGGFSASNLLEARKAFDDWVTSQKNSKVVFGDRATAMGEAVKTLRGELNNLIAEKVPDAGFKTSMAKQSNIYRAMDNLETKIGLEGKNAASRFVERSADSIPGKTPIVKAGAVAAGVAPLLVEPTLATVAGAGYGAYKAATAPITRKALGGAIGGAGRAVQGVSGGVGRVAPSVPVAGALGAKAYEPEQPQPRPSLDDIFSDAPQVQMEPMSYQSTEGDYFQKLAQAESGGNPNAKAKTSSASGLYQFTNDTWNASVQRWGKELGVSHKDKNDPEAQHKMVQKLTESNANYIKKQVGIEPDDGQLYLAHFMGAPAAVKLMKNYGTGVSAAQLFPKAAKANQSIFFKNGRPRSVEEVYQVVTSKVGDA